MTARRPSQGAQGAPDAVATPGVESAPSDAAEADTAPREGCVHESCWYPACAAPTECGGTLDCCAMQACDSTQCPAEFPFRQETPDAWYPTPPTEEAR